MKLHFSIYTLLDLSRNSFLVRNPKIDSAIAGTYPGPTEFSPQSYTVTPLKSTLIVLPFAEVSRAKCCNIMKLLVTQFSSFDCHFLSLRIKYSARHRVLINTLNIYYLFQARDQVSNPYKKLVKLQFCVLYIF
jgi:hypothetical protein